MNALKTLLAVAAVALLAGPAVAADAPVPFRLATVVPKGDAGFFNMAAAGGFAAKQGIDLQMVSFQGDTLMLKALLAGQVEAFEGSPIGPMIADSKGADLRVVGCSWPRLTYSMFSRDDIASLADLKGKTIGVSAPGSLPDLVGRTMLRQAGVDPASVRIVMAGADPDRIRAIVAKVVDAAISTSDFAARPDLHLKTLAHAADTLPQFLRTCFITTATVLKKEPDAVVRFLTAEMNAYAYALGHRDAVVALTRKVTSLPASDPTPEVSFTETIQDHAISPTLDMDRAKFLWLRDLLARDGRLDAKFDPDSMIDAGPREQALQRADH